MIFWLLSQAAEQIKLLYELFLKVDATQVEINPFGETPDGKGILYYPTCWLITETYEEVGNPYEKLMPYNSEFSHIILTHAVIN